MTFGCQECHFTGNIYASRLFSKFALTIYTSIFRLSCPIFMVDFDIQEGKIRAPILLINAMHLGKTPNKKPVFGTLRFRRASKSKAPRRTCILSLLTILKQSSFESLTTQRNFSFFHTTFNPPPPCQSNKLTAPKRSRSGRK
jgi:hypothetical protein